MPQPSFELGRFLEGDRNQTLQPQPLLREDPDPGSASNASSRQNSQRIRPQAPNRLRMIMGHMTRVSRLELPPSPSRKRRSHEKHEEKLRLSNSKMKEYHRLIDERYQRACKRVDQDPIKAPDVEAVLAEEDSDTRQRSFAFRQLESVSAFHACLVDECSHAMEAARQQDCNGQVDVARLAVLEDARAELIRRQYRLQDARSYIKAGMDHPSLKVIHELLEMMSSSSRLADAHLPVVLAQHESARRSDGARLAQETYNRVNTQQRTPQPRKPEILQRNQGLKQGAGDREMLATATFHCPWISCYDRYHDISTTLLTLSPSQHYICAHTNCGAAFTRSEDWITHIHSAHHDILDPDAPEEDVHPDGQRESDTLNQVASAQNDDHDDFEDFEKRWRYGEQHGAEQYEASNEG
ncbi:hypothetical protein LTR04_001811 [Oleoguttula sp. CCFEE 6159]|nr:hypothetical protein LTR04_001811 [Oleoguttula sp. CCFEE 6159]